MNYSKKLYINPELRTANIFGVGVNAVTASLETVTAFSNSEQTYFSRTNPAYKLPYFLFGFVLFLAAAMKVAAVLFKGALKLISVMLEIAPRGILFFLSLINLVIFRCSLSSAEWLMRSKAEDDNSHFCSNNLPLFSPYVQQDFNLFES